MVHNLPLIVVNCHGYKTLLAVISHQFWLVVLDIFLLSVFAMVDWLANVFGMEATNQ